VRTTCPESLCEADRPGLELATSRLQVRRLNHYCRSLIIMLAVDDQDERSVSSVLLRDRHLHGILLPRERDPRHRRHGVRRLQETRGSRGG